MGLRGQLRGPQRRRSAHEHARRQAKQTAAAAALLADSTKRPLSAAEMVAMHTTGAFTVPTLEGVAARVAQARVGLGSVDMNYVTCAVCDARQPWGPGGFRELDANCVVQRKLAFFTNMKRRLVPDKALPPPW